MLSVDGVPSVAEGTTGVQPAGRAEKAAAVRPEALGPGRMASKERGHSRWRAGIGR